MSFSVQLTDDAARDLSEICEHIRLHDSPDRADFLLDKFEAVFQRLSEHPQRGAYPNELLELGIREFRQVFFKPYRIVYRVIGNNVYVLLVADGRRDMQSLLQHRLLRG